MTDVSTDVSSSAASAPRRRVVAVIDGNSLMHRAFHAVPPTMNAPDGAPPTPSSAFSTCSSRWSTLLTRTA